MKWIKIILTSIYMIIAIPALGSDTIEGVNDLGTKFKLSKKDWPIAFNCYQYPNGTSLMFSIRENNGEPVGVGNAWLIFPDHAGYAGKLYLDGLSRRFDWTAKNTARAYSLRIHIGGAGFYYDWSRADSEGKMKGVLYVNCK